MKLIRCPGTDQSGHETGAGSFYDLLEIRISLHYQTFATGRNRSPLTHRFPNTMIYGQKRRRATVPPTVALSG